VKVQLRSKAPDASVEALIATQAKPEHAALRVAGNAAIYKPNGELLLLVRKAFVSEGAAARAYPFLHGLRTTVSYNRGAYAGSMRSSGFNVDPITGRRIKADGTISNTLEKGKVRSAVVGNMDRYPRMPFCRQCALSSEKPEEWAECLPMVQEVARGLEAAAPLRYRAQLDAAEKTHPAYVIAGTPFTTLTVNNTVSGAYHRDAGDFKPGFGAMAVLRRGRYEGCEIVLPAYGVAVDLEDRDVIYFDVHEVHGNTPFRVADGPPCEPENGGHERLSIVFYFREKMTECLSPAEEVERAKNIRGGLEKLRAKTEPDAQDEPS
jgi:hypothetical protein